MSSVINETLLAIKSAFEAGVNIFNGGSAVSSSNPLPVAHQSWASANNFLNIGSDADGGSNAYINDVRVSSGVAYSGNFTPPSSPFTV